MCVVLTNYVPLRVSLLMFAALCYYIIFCKCGLLFGLLDIAVSLLLTFFIGAMSPLTPAFLLTAVVFAPYALISYAMKKLYYTKWQTALVRIAVIVVFANLALLFVWLLAAYITSIDIAAILAAVGGYAVLAVIVTALTLVFDFLFNQLSIRLLKLIK